MYIGLNMFLALIVPVCLSYHYYAVYRETKLKDQLYDIFSNEREQYKQRIENLQKENIHLRLELMKLQQEKNK